MNRTIARLICLGIAVLTSLHSFSQSAILKPVAYKHYIDSFNQQDNELYKEYVPNDKSWEFLSKNIPFLDCPDKSMEQTYYFRWWTYRKHIKQTPEGFVITEFLPKVSWAGKYNTISCAAALHFYEGRWLHDQKILTDYARFWFLGGGNIRSYSFWPSDAIYNYFLVTGNDSNCKELLPEMIKNYEIWEKGHIDPNGLFWQIDDRDGMEASVCGNGYRATINSYMFAEAIAISNIALRFGQKDLSDRFKEKASVIKEKLQSKLWDSNGGFFKVLSREKDARLCTTRELHGYTPWCFNLPDNGYSVAWKFLMDSTKFYAPYGLTTTEQSDPGFKIEYKGHECQWNGPSWPYSTSITLIGLANLLNNYSQKYISKNDYFKLLKDYANSQQLKQDNGNMVPWIDENLNPFTGDWISRTRLKSWKNGTWSADKGGVERGKDYNHSAFCDLIISGLIGIRPQPDNRIIINPLIPEHSWNYFCLDNILYHGKILTVIYDETGKQYGRGKGFFVFVNGKRISSSKTINKVNLKI